MSHNIEVFTDGHAYARPVRKGMLVPWHTKLYCTFFLGHSLSYSLGDGHRRNTCFTAEPTCVFASRPSSRRARNVAESWESGTALAHWRRRYCTWLQRIHCSFHAVLSRRISGRRLQRIRRNPASTTQSRTPLKKTQRTQWQTKCSQALSGCLKQISATANSDVYFLAIIANFSA